MVAPLALFTALPRLKYAWTLFENLRANVSLDCGVKNISAMNIIGTGGIPVSTPPDAGKIPPLKAAVYAAKTGGNPVTKVPGGVSGLHA